MEWDITGDVSTEIVDTEQLCYKYIDTDPTRKGCMAFVCPFSRELTLDFILL